MKPRIALLALALVIFGCSSGSFGSADACADAARMCNVPISTCSPLMQCEAECLLDVGCVTDQRLRSCVASRCAFVTDDAAIGETHTGNNSPPDVDSGTTESDDAGEGADTSSDPSTDASTGGAWGCSQDTANSCTCAAGVTPDGKGCSTSTVEGPAVCCASDSRCRCESIACTATSSGCSCYVAGVPSKLTSCTGPLCCKFPASSAWGFGACACYTGGKPGGCGVLGGVEVSSCTASNVECYYKDEHTVSTCN